MAAASPRERGDQPSADNQQVSLLLDLAKAQVAEAFAIAQLLEAKARSIQQTSMIFFAASQTVVGVIVALGKSDGPPLWITLTATVLALVGIVCLVFGAVRAIGLQEPQNQLTLDTAAMARKLIEFAEDDDPRVSRLLLKELGNVAAEREASNCCKVANLGRVQFWSFGALFASCGTLVFGMSAAFLSR